MKKKILSLFMAVVLCFSTLPAAVLAENYGNGAEHSAGNRAFACCAKRRGKTV